MESSLRLFLRQDCFTFGDFRADFFKVHLRFFHLGEYFTLFFYVVIDKKRTHKELGLPYSK